MTFNVFDELKQHFGDYDSPLKEDSWQAVKKALSVTSIIKGKVIARFPFGVFLDAGLGFPILLEIINMSHLSPEKYRTQYSKDLCYRIGDEICGSNVTFNDRNRQIGIAEIQSQ